MQKKKTKPNQNKTKKPKQTNKQKTTTKEPKQQIIQKHYSYCIGECYFPKCIKLYITPIYLFFTVKVNRFLRNRFTARSSSASNNILTHPLPSPLPAPASSQQMKSRHREGGESSKRQRPCMRERVTRVGL